MTARTGAKKRREYLFGEDWTVGRVFGVCCLSWLKGWLVRVCWVCMRRRASGQLSRPADPVACQSLEKTECREQYFDKLRPNPFNPGSLAPSRGPLCPWAGGPCQAHIRLCTRELHRMSMDFDQESPANRGLNFCHHTPR